MPAGCLYCTLVGVASDRDRDSRDERVAQLRKGVLELAILALLADEPSYGGEIVERLARHDGLAASRGTVYPVLARLKKADAVTTSWQESPVGPPRKYYALTAQGRASLADLRQAWAELHGAVTDLMGGTKR